MKDKTRNYMLKMALGALVLGMIFFIGMIDEISSWKMLCPDPVTVQAVVTDNKEYSESRGRHHHGKVYHYSYAPYITYTCKGNEYTTLLYRNDFSPTPLGTEMTVTVDGAHPKKILTSPEPVEIFVGVTLTLVFFSVSGAAFYEFRKPDVQL